LASAVAVQIVDDHHRINRGDDVLAIVINVERASGVVEGEVEAADWGDAKIDAAGRLPAADGYDGVALGGSGDEMAGRSRDVNVVGAIRQEPQRVSAEGVRGARCAGPPLERIEN